MKIVRQKAPGDHETKEKIALAAALVHDVGHGPFSHAFESVGDRLGLKLADHEVMSDELIRNGEIADILNEDIMPGFAANVANMIKKEGKITLHNSVVSSQFDADRLDYMQRDRMMTGSKHSAIDLTWLLANLDIGEVATGVDDTELRAVPTFVIGPKAIQAAEAYVLGLFQLYPTIYFHKATRGAEKLFIELLVRIVELTGAGSADKTGLPQNHPLIKFAKNPDSIDTALQLDDTVVWGALHLLQDADDKLLSKFSSRLLNRKLLKCFDIRTTVEHEVDPHNEGGPENVEKIEKRCASAILKLQAWQSQQTDVIPRIITDVAERTPYKIGGGSNGPLEQINVRTEGGELIELSQRSEIVKSLSVFFLNRVYYDSADDDALKTITSIVKGEID
ncbi:MAG: hypothetical protein COA52_15910 [Hyphomicrobiales bacterium]|nr:MAG: hypothetical protein COA52_15910 [Hyphomicrobiales bacterium]